MASVGVRELRQSASELLRRVEAGETIEVTDRGRPVALLTPVSTAIGLELLRQTGDATPPRATFDTLPAPLRLDSASELPSQILARLRDEE
ncbi:MAG: type II toxin-antitoxin system prevent-host-death family antitoxin [Deltaproteobacteria bacterium]|nr:type II toxin-antitoxin system prevent-host-death family antitoxin [Deltaproteobacteria bacterium]